MILSHRLNCFWLRIHAIIAQKNTVTTEPSPKDMRGEGGGIYLIYSEAEIESGTINENTAIATAPDEYGNVSGGLGGAISA